MLFDWQESGKLRIEVLEKSVIRIEFRLARFVA